MRCKALLAVALGAVLALVGCGGGGRDGDGVPAQRKAAVAAHYADGVHAAYGASIAGAQRLQAAIAGFARRPDEGRLARARRAWRAAREDYVVTEAFRFYGGPIDARERGVAAAWREFESALGSGDRPGRRAAALRDTTQRLLADLRAVRAPWAPRGGTYRARFLADPDAALQRIMRGIDRLNGDLARERLAGTADGGGADRGRSAAGATANADVVSALKGIRIVYTGEFAGLAGEGPDALVAHVQPGLAAELRAALATTLADAEAFSAPLKRMLAAPRGSAEHEALAGAIAAIRAQGALLARAARAIES